MTARSTTGRHPGIAVAARREPRPAGVAGGAREALRFGQAALANGEAGTAVRWLDRAARLAPADRTIALALAAACLMVDPVRAERLFAGECSRSGSAEAAFGLAVARLRRHDAVGAAGALTRALQRHALASDAAATADAIVRAAGLPGWCAIRTGALVIGLTDPDRGIAVDLDGEALVLPGRAARRTRLLPPMRSDGGVLCATVDGRPLAGSPLDLAAFRRVEGFVEASAGGLRGWAWHPADPTRRLALQVRGPAPAGSVLTIAPPVRRRGRPRQFRVPATALAELGSGPLHVTGPDGAPLLGSPLDPARAAAPPPAPAGRARALSPSASPPGPVAADVVIPVRDAGAPALACIASVLATVGPDSRVVVVDDGSREPALVAALDDLAARRRIALVRHPTGRGFPASANAGLRAIEAGHDAVLLNSDTLVAPGWLERLRRAAHAAADIGTVSPFSNNATILSYPDAARGSPMPDRAATARLASLAHRANGGATVDIPTGVGFCLYLRRDCLDSVGTLREDLFAQGYGEENDYCMRALALGWRHVAAPGVFVAHQGGASFGEGAAGDLARRNARALSRLHPAYDGLVAAFVAADPLAAPRRRLDRARWRATRGSAGAVVLVAHDQGGGVERVLRRRCAALAAEGIRPILLRPAADQGVAVGEGTEGGFPNLRFAMPAERAGLVRLLARDRPRMVEFHHMLGHHPALLELPALLGVPHSVIVHDHAWFCPRVVLLGGGRRYCGEPRLAGCEACVAENGSAFDETIPVAAYVARSERVLRTAAAVTAPSSDTVSRMRRHFPALAVAAVPHGAPLPRLRPRAPARTYASVAVVGAIGAAKGYDVLLAAAEDAARRHLPLRFTVVGLTDDDARLMAAGPVFVTGRYEPEEAEALIAAQRADVGWLPSVVPETWCFALDECWSAGLDVLAFDLGAQAERIRRTGRGWLVPLGLPPSGLNDALLAAARQTRQEWPDDRATKNCDAAPP